MSCKKITLHDMAYHAPHFATNLAQATSQGGLFDLVRAGLLRQVYADPAHSYMMFYLTEKGQKIASSLGWATDGLVLDFPVGHFELVDDSAVMTPGEKSPYGQSLKITYKFRFVGDANAAYLRSIGAPGGWEISSFGSLALTLADVGKVFSRSTLAWCKSPSDCDDIQGREDYAVRTIPTVTPFHIHEVPTIEDRIRSYLADDAPWIGGGLSRAHASPDVENLKHAGFVEQTGTWESCPDSGITLAYTERGIETAYARGWQVADDFLQIPVGRFAYVPKSVKLSRAGAHADEVATFQYRFEGNSNATFLERIANGKSWRVRAFWGGRDLRLSDVGKIYTGTVAISTDLLDSFTDMRNYGPAVIC